MTPEELAERIHPSKSVERRHAESDLEAVRLRTAGIVRAEIERLNRALVMSDMELNDLRFSMEEDCGESALTKAIDELSQRCGFPIVTNRIQVLETIGNKVERQQREIDDLRRQVADSDLLLGDSWRDVVDIARGEEGVEAALRKQIFDLAAKVDELTAENAGLRAAITRGGFDISPCMECGKAVVCVPDGLACCGDCAAKLSDAANSEAEENRR